MGLLGGAVRSECRRCSEMGKISPGMEGGLPSELPGTVPLECGEFQRPESLCADRNELGSQSPEFPWQDEDEDEDDEEDDEEE